MTFLKIRPTAIGAITQLYAGTAPEAKDLNGKVTITVFIRTEG